MEFLSDNQLNDFAATHTILISYLKAIAIYFVGTPIGAWLLAKTAAIINKNITSDKPIDFIRNKWGSDQKVHPEQEKT